MSTHWQAVFFDFDGVILDSVPVKTQAFAQLFRPHGSDVEQAVVDYHLANGGISRFKKFEYAYRHLLNQPLTPELAEALGQEFNRLALDGVLAAPFIDGALDTLQALLQDGVPAFVVSGTPHEEVGLVVEKRDLADYFLEVHGSPRSKASIVQDIAARHGFQLRECLFIGDAMTDFNTAQTCGTAFLGIVTDGESPFPLETQVLKKVGIDLL